MDGDRRMYPRSPGLVLFTRLGVVVALAVLIGGAAIRVALPARADVVVGTDPVGAHVELDHGGTWVETRPRSGATATPTGCRRRWIPSGAFELRITPLGDYRQVPMDEPRPGPEYSPYQVWCDADYLGAVWIRPQQFGVDPLVIAERLVRDLPYPAATVGAHPATRGLTGLEIRFWVGGYTTVPITDAVTAFGMRVEVEATPGTVSWDFGDGTTLNGGGVGSTPTTLSEVAHIFEVRARPTFAVRALLNLAVRWRLNGGPWQSLDPIARSALLSYPVVESRAALVPDRLNRRATRGDR